MVEAEVADDGDLHGDHADCVPQEGGDACPHCCCVEVAQEARAALGWDGALAALFVEPTGIRPAAERDVSRAEGQNGCHGLCEYRRGGRVPLPTAGPWRGRRKYLSARPGSRRQDTVRDQTQG